MPLAGCSSLLPNPVTAPGTGLRGGNPVPWCALSVLPQNVRETAVFAPVLAQMLTHPGRGEGSAPGCAPGCGVRVMGCVRGRGRGENGYRITLRSAGALPGKILRLRPGACCFVPARICETVRRFSVLQSHSISA